MPDQNPLYKDLPRPDSFEFFRKCLQGHGHVSSFTEPASQVFNIQRPRCGQVILYLTNIYCVSAADVFDISSRVAGLNCIVTISAWNGYTSEAKNDAKLQGIGLFKHDEYMGALRLSGNKFLDYCRSEKSR